MNLDIQKTNDIASRYTFSRFKISAVKILEGSYFREHNNSKALSCMIVYQVVIQ